MRCSEAQELISEYLDQQLDPSRQQQLEAHLESCSQCRVLAADMEQLIAGLAALPRLNPPADLVARAMEKSARKGRWSLKPWQRQVLAACLAGFLLLAGNLFFWQAGGHWPGGFDRSKAMGEIAIESDRYAESEEPRPASVEGWEESQDGSRAPSGSPEPEQDEDTKLMSDGDRAAVARSDSRAGKPWFYFNLAAVPVAGLMIYLMGKGAKGDTE